MRGISLALLCFPLLLSGCNNVEDDLADCLGESEPTMLLRQLNMSNKQRETFEFCQNSLEMTKSFCRALYLNANTPVRICMKRRGYTFTDVDSGYGTCHWGRYQEAKCYGLTWYLWIDAIATALRPSK